jgi:choline-sulfatase
MHKKPNILVIMSDQHDPKVTGCYGDRVVHTPCLDRMASEGITFDACYTNSPLCVPARLSFTAGKYINRIGIWGNHFTLPSNDYPSLPRILKESGYESVLSGKMHYRAGHRYGFSELFPSVYNPFETDEYLAPRRKFDDVSSKAKNWSDRVADFRVGDRSKVLDHDRLVTQHATQFLKNRKASDKPFFMLAGYISPHFPLTVPSEFFDKVRDRVPMPHLPKGAIDRLPTNYQHLRRGFGLVDIKDEEIKLGRECYWALISWMDNEIGKILNSMPSEIAENTIVIYTSDHGENKGDHGLWWKSNMYEHSARVPLIVRYPERWKGSQRRASVCSLVDVVQTILELGGEESPDDWNGDSLVDLLDDAKASWKNFAASEYFAHHIGSGFSMWRHENYKYVYHTRFDEEHGPERELYDLSIDSGEFNNLADQPEFQTRIQEMHSRMVKELGQDPEKSEAICRKMRHPAKVKVTGV